MSKSQKRLRRENLEARILELQDVQRIQENSGNVELADVTHQQIAELYQRLRDIRDGMISL